MSQANIIRLLTGMKENCNFDIVSREWKLIGGNRHFRLNLWRTNRPNQELPSRMDTCYCGTNMTENCYIWHEKSQTLLTICSNCVTRLIQEEKIKRCVLCFEQHNHKSDNYCDSCRGGLLTAGKYKGRSFYWVYYHDREYARCIATNDRYCVCQNLRDFSNWLNQKYPSQMTSSSEESKPQNRKRSATKLTELESNDFKRQKAASSSSFFAAERCWSPIKNREYLRNKTQSILDMSWVENEEKEEYYDNYSETDISQTDELEDIEESEGECLAHNIRAPYNRLYYANRSSESKAKTFTTENFEVHELEDIKESQVLEPSTDKVDSTIPAKFLTLTSKLSNFSNNRLLGSDKNLGFGQYAGYKYSYIHLYHNSYCKWVLKQKNPCSAMKAFQLWLQKPMA